MSKDMRVRAPPPAQSRFQWVTLFPLGQYFSFVLKKNEYKVVAGFESDDKETSFKIELKNLCYALKTLCLQRIMNKADEIR